MVKLQPHKKIVVQSDLRRQASTVAKQAVLPSRDPRTVCMTEGELGYLLSSFRVNRWPERAEKERLAQLIGKYVLPSLLCHSDTISFRAKVIREGSSLVLKPKAEDGECRESNEKTQESAYSPAVFQCYRRTYRRDGTGQGPARETRNVTKSSSSGRLRARG
jgi:hypothetical protein